MRSLLILIPALLGTLAQAGQIQMEQRLSTTLENGRLRLYVTAHNLGPDSTLKVQPIVWFLGRPHPLPTLERLEPDTFYQQRLDLPLPEPGAYGLLVDLRYRSPRAGYSLPAFIANPDYRPPQQLELRWLPPADPPRLQIHNHSGQPLTVTLTVLAPWELGLEPPPRQITLAAGERRTLKTPLRYLEVAGHQSTAVIHALADFSTPQGHRIAYAALNLHAAPWLATLPWGSIAVVLALTLGIALLWGLGHKKPPADKTG